MKQTVTKYDFIDAFRGHMDKFTLDAILELFDHFEQLEEYTGEEIDLDVVEICGDFAQDDPQTIREAYSLDTADPFELAQRLDLMHGFGRLLDDGTIVYAKR